jgi:hypothetical protein
MLTTQKTESRPFMFTSSENFDIADLKRSSVKMKGALQAEWQEVIKAGSATAESHVELTGLELVDDQSRAFLPRIDLTLMLKGNGANVGYSYVPSLSNLQGQGAPLAFNPLAISQMSC